MSLVTPPAKKEKFGDCRWLAVYWRVVFARDVDYDDFVLGQSRCFLITSTTCEQWSEMKDSIRQAKKKVEKSAVVEIGAGVVILLPA